MDDLMIDSNDNTADKAVVGLKQPILKASVKETLEAMMLTHFQERLVAGLIPAARFFWRQEFEMGHKQSQALEITAILMQKKWQMLVPGNENQLHQNICWQVP
jgi:hypothetical protein